MTRASAVLDALRAGRSVLDNDFDAVYPPPVRDLSRGYWTPVDVARTAAEWLTEAGAERVLDVGAGVGKFCLVGAAVVPGATFVGIEHRSHLVNIASEAARRLSLRNTMMLQGTIDIAPWREIQAFYLFNPFAENTFETGLQLDDVVELSLARFHQDVSFVERALAEAPAGTRVATYHGFGGQMPEAYQLVRDDPRGFERLRFFRKRP